MRKLINVLFVAAGLVFTANVANAQQKLGHINSADIYSNFNDAKTASASLETFIKGKREELSKMGTEYQAKVAAAQKRASEISDANRAALTKELQDAEKDILALQSRIQAAETKAQTDAQAKEAELFTPVNQKVATAMNAVAKEKGLAYVFDIAAQGGNNLVYFDGGDDITAAVKTKLGISASSPTPVKKP
ncbi:MAG: OmpH family outer membrane protein [Pedobacter sp.]|nr:MAG: OmpH family outer membrane protein [Pedobacter sp.]